MDNESINELVQTFSQKDSVIKAFCDGKQLTEETLVAFTGLNNQLNECKFFIGVNVKTSSGEPVQPIQYGIPVKYIKPDIDKLKYIIPYGLDELCERFKYKPFDVTFEWNRPPKGGKWKSEDAQIKDVKCNYSSGTGIITDFFKDLGPTIKSTNSQTTGYHVIGHVVDNSEDWKDRYSPFHVWIRTVDYDIGKEGQPLSYILAICEDEKALKRIKEKELEIYDYIMLVKAGYRKRIEDERMKESIKSAIASIMSRNMSHNLGSHYLYYTKNQLAKLADKHSEKMDADSPDIRGAAKVLGYMQARMDYLATIVAGDKYPYGSVFFKGQIFDELTIDDFSKRHFEKGEENGTRREYRRTTNYLLQNLILSENFTRNPVLEETDTLLQKDKKNIRIQIRTATKDYPFTGTTSNEDQEIIKLEISKLCVALPGGIMSIHAFFNVIENLIRNSAKYNKEDFKDKEELVFTIRINELKGTNDLPIRYEFVVFDNKANANNIIKVKKGTDKEKEVSLLDSMRNRLKKLKILKDHNELDKNDKGLKEILFSTLWMRSYTYAKSQKMSDILADLDRMEGDYKLDEIKKHAFEYVAVDDKGNVQEDTKGQKKLNLGIRFELPKYRMMENVRSGDIDNNLNLIEKGLNNFTDILCVDETYEELPTLKTQFTRVSEGTVTDENNESEAVERLRKILQRRFANFDKYRLKMDGNGEDGFEELCDDKKHYGIYFKTHEANPTIMKEYSYCEAISGENFTKTMQNIFDNGHINNGYRDAASEYFGLKIKESALTRITLIDERLFNDMSDVKKQFLSLKNIRVLNLKEDNEDNGGFFDFVNRFRKPQQEVDTFFVGNNFRDNVGNATHFLSIHLGMIEKIIKDNSPWIKAFKLEKATLNERIEKLMTWLKESFKTEKGEIFISIHSGRGNFSPDLDDSLKHYPFISVSAIESAYSNSKYLLAQLFYNTVYIGKGVSNG